MDGLYLKITQDFTPDPKEARFGGKDSPMAVEKGDIIFDVRKRGDGWMYGKNLNSGKVGKFPESCAAKLTGNNKIGSGSGSQDSDKKDENKVDKKPAVTNELGREKPAWLQSRTTTPITKKAPLYPKPFAGSMRTPQEKEKEERKETSGDSGVVEDSPDGNYCNDDEKPTNRNASKTGNTVKDDKHEPKIELRSLQTVHKQKPEAKATGTDRVKEIGRPFKLNLSKSGEGSKPSESRAVPRLNSKNTTTADTPRSLQPTQQDDLNEEENYEPVEKKKSEGKKLQAKETPKPVQPKEEPKVADIKAANINPRDNQKKVEEKIQSNVTNSSSAGGAAVNIQDNPLSKDESSIYQVPSVIPPKPARSNVPGCTECNEPHVYETPMHYKTPPSSPSTDKRDKYEPTIEKPKEEKYKRKGGSTSLKPTSSVIKKTKEQMKHRMASYESIEAEGRRSTESIKDAVRAVNETKEKLLAPNKRPKIRILMGTLLGLLLGVFIFLTLYLLAHLHVVVCVVSALLIGFVVATIFGFLDRTRLQCITLLVFPSLFGCGGKILFWLLITFFIVSGPACNFIDNVRIVTQSRACLMETHNLRDNRSSNLSDFFLMDGNNRALVQRVHKYENISQAARNYIETALLSSSDRRDKSFKSNYSSEVICMTYLRRAYNICSREADNMYTNCTRLKTSLKCEFLKPMNACDHLSDAQIQDTCEHINSANNHTLWQIKKILEQSPEALRTKDMPSDSDHTTIVAGKPCEFVKIIAMLLPLLAFLVLYEAYRYHKLYLSWNEFDNHFLTLRFKAIEDMRKSSGAADLLVPLKKAELQKFVQPTACQLAESEKRSMLKYLLFYFIYLMFALMIILLDHYFFVVITGDKEVRSNISKRCNGDLKKLKKTYIIILSSLLGILLLIILLQAFILRLRRLISSRFYPRRERKRIAYLYYKLLEERKTFYKSVIESMNNFSEETEMLNRLDAVLVLCNTFSWVKAVFEFVGIDIRRCAVCGTGLNKKYLYCDTEDCDVIYCRTCFWDLENKCLGCMRSSKMTSCSSSLSGQSQKRKNDYVKPV